MIEDRPAQIEDETFTDAGGQPAAEEAEDGLRDRNSGNDQRKGHNRPGGLRLDDRLDDAAGEQRSGNRQDRGDNTDCKECRQLGAALPGEPKDPAQGLP